MKKLLGEKIWLDQHVRTWLYRLAIAVSYGVVITLVRQVSISHWMLLTGVHVCVLLLMPYRYWPALIAGEMVSLVPSSITGVDKGLFWQILNVIPSTILLAPLVYWVRQRWHLFQKTNALPAWKLLVLALMASIIVTAISVVFFAIIKVPSGYVRHYDQAIAYWMLGDYLGILTVVPPVLLVRQLWQQERWPDKLAINFTVAESITYAMVAFVVLIWLGISTPSLRHIAQVIMFLPVLWLAMRHGWPGAALGGMVANIAVVVLMPERHDVDTLQAQVIIAIVISTMLLVGNRISELHQRADQDHANLRMAMALAERNALRGDMWLRKTSRALEQLHRTVEATHMAMLKRLRLLSPNYDYDNEHYEKPAITIPRQLYQIADAIYPVTWGNRGLRGALREGSLLGMLEEYGIAYRYDVRGSLSLLSPGLHLSIYRIICEAIADACVNRMLSAVMVQIRCGGHYDHGWVVLSIHLHAQPAALERIHWEALIPGAARSASGAGRRAINDRAATYQGQVRERKTSKGCRLTMLLRDLSP